MKKLVKESLNQFNKFDSATVLLDWQDFSTDAADEFKHALNSIGVYMYQVPTGDDNYMFILSKKPLSKAEIRAAQY